MYITTYGTLNLTKIDPLILYNRMELMLLQTAISGVGSLLQKLYQRFQQAKVTDAEFNELQEFMSYVQIHSGTCTSYGANTALKQKLEDTNKKLEDWSSENSRFLSRSSDERVRELHALRESVKLVIDMEIFKMLRSIYGNAKNPAGNVKNPAGNAKNPAGKTQVQYVLHKYYICHSSLDVCTHILGVG
jgi:hypothetical protein